MKKSIGAFWAIILFLNLAPANANVLIVAKQVGDDVVFETSGFIDLTGINRTNAGSLVAAIEAGPSCGCFFSNTGDVDFYRLTSTTQFGDGPGVIASSSEGDTVGIFTMLINSGGEVTPFAFLPLRYESGTPLSAMTTFSLTTIVGLGLFEGDFVQTFANGQTITMRITPAEVPLPAALPLFAAGLAGLGLIWRRRNISA